MQKERDMNEETLVRVSEQEKPDPVADFVGRASVAIDAMLALVAKRIAANAGGDPATAAAALRPELISLLVERITEELNKRMIDQGMPRTQRRANLKVKRRDIARTASRLVDDRMRSVGMLAA